jgi:hypothetical protein
MVRRVPLMTIALVSLVATPVVVQAMAARAEAPAPAVPEGRAEATAPMAGEICGKKVRVVYQGLNEGREAARCPAVVQ